MSWHIACFCGTSWKTDDRRAVCPVCGEPVPAPLVSYQDEAAMRDELQTILDEHRLVE